MSSDERSQAPSALTSAALPICCQAWVVEQTRPWGRRAAAGPVPVEPSRPNDSTDGDPRGAGLG